MKTFAVVPVKELDKAKTRLSQCLTPRQRKSLLLAMLDDVLSALTELPTIVISPKDMSPRFEGVEGLTFLLQTEGRDLNNAVRQANAFALKKGAHATLFVPADMPLITKKDVDEILELGKKYSVVITHASDGGTGILYRRPPAVMESRFTENSFHDHRLEATKKGIEMYVHESLQLSLDIDTLDDITSFMIHGGGTGTYQLLKSWKFK
jgi:2-phospho-L-lactate guanylyltransferase